MSELQEKHVSNNSFFRRVSDFADAAGLKDHPRIRGAVHGVYHDGVGLAKRVCGNKEGSDAERRRAQQQYHNARSPSPK